jgi:DNA-binding transcriptional ArsR family regulator
MSDRLASLDTLLRALADPTRRSVIERLGRGPASMSELARDHDMALPSFLQHLQRLETNGLVRSHKDGRIRIYRLVPLALAPVTLWLEQQRMMWERRLDQLDDYLTQMKESDP